MRFRKLHWCDCMLYGMIRVFQAHTLAFGNGSLYPVTIWQMHVKPMVVNCAISRGSLWSQWRLRRGAFLCLASCGWDSGLPLSISLTNACGSKPRVVNHAISRSGLWSQWRLHHGAFLCFTSCRRDSGMPLSITCLLNPFLANLFHFRPAYHFWATFQPFSGSPTSSTPLCF